MLAQGGEQMTTERTAIRRWLSIGGSPHRPPGRARKRGHRSIVAPLAATLAASAAVGLGMALARGSLRTSGARRLKRPLGLQDGEGLPEGLRRMALEQADVALAQLAGAEGGGARKAVHETRKAIKRLRTIVRLLEGELGAETCAREQATLRAAAEHLAGARDAEVMLDTLDALLAERPRKLGGRKGVARLRRHLVNERDEAERRMLAPRNRMLVADELRLFRARALAWELAPRPGIGAIEEGLHRIYRQGRKRKRRAGRSRGGRMRTMHQWRKRVKDLRYAAETLRRAEPAPGPLSRLPGKRRKRISAEARWVRRLAGRADELGELLGEEHDLAVFGAWLAEHGKAAGAPRATRRRLRNRIVRRRRKLRRRALRDGRRLYSRKPRAFLRRVARAYAKSAPPAS
jgi:CHAD domain-containing protein